MPILCEGTAPNRILHTSKLIDIQGKCWRGEACNLLHEPAINGDVEAATPTEGHDFNMPCNSDTTVATNDASARSESSSPTIAQIPVNKLGSRIDLPLPDIFKADKDAYYLRVNKKRLCNDHVLAGCCTKENCPFDHSTVEQNIVNVLRSVVRSKFKCPKGAQCRSRTCYKSHMKGTPLSESDRLDCEYVPAEDWAVLSWPGWSRKQIMVNILDLVTVCYREMAVRISTTIWRLPFPGYFSSITHIIINRRRLVVWSYAYWKSSLVFSFGAFPPTCTAILPSPRLKSNCYHIIFANFTTCCASLKQTPKQTLSHVFWICAC